MNIRHLTMLAAIAIMANASPAAAHVTLATPVVTGGTLQELTFRCPNERATAATTQLVIQMPEHVPLRLVDVRPIAGWHINVTMRKLDTPLHSRHGDITTAVDTVTWSGGSIKPGEYQDFSILAGPLPTGVHDLPFKAVQTYSNGEVVRWIQLRGPNDPVQPNPAPILHVH